MKNTKAHTRQRIPRDSTKPPATADPPVAVPPPKRATKPEPVSTSVLAKPKLPERLIDTDMDIKFDPRWSDKGKRRWLELRLQAARSLNAMREDIDVKSGRDGVRSPDELDNVQRSLERELGITNANRETKQGRAIQAAIDAIDAEEYGTCIDCEDEDGIPLNRLAAVPWALRCTKCAEVAELREKDPGLHQEDEAA